MTAPTVEDGRPPEPERTYLIALRGRPVSPEAVGLVDDILQRVVLSGAAKVVRPTSAVKLGRAIGALLADLFELQAEHAQQHMAIAGAHGTSPKDFSDTKQGFGRSIFLQAISSLEAAGLLEITLGTASWQKAFGKWINRGGTVTTYRLTPALIDLALSHGVPVNDWRHHWSRSSCVVAPKVKDDNRLVLRGAKVRKGRDKGNAKDMTIDYADPAVVRILEGIDRLNEHWRQQSIGGFSLVGLRRIFSRGDQPDFAWNKGGRYYSLPGGHHYELWSGTKRRETITINGEPVAEVDLRASHLTLLHGLLGMPFDSEDDPYRIVDIPRTVVKLWVAQAIGSSNPRPRQWSSTSQADYEAERPGQFLGDSFPIREVGAAITAKHPVLIDLHDCGFDTLDLQFHEAEILRLAMEDLMFRQGITVLPMHDALIAPRSRLEETKEALMAAFQCQVASVIGHPPLTRPKVTFEKPEACQSA